jgi:hypothetical protein
VRVENAPLKRVPPLPLMPVDYRYTGAMMVSA